MRLIIFGSASMVGQIIGDYSATGFKRKSWFISWHHATNGVSSVHANLEMPHFASERKTEIKNPGQLLGAFSEGSHSIA